MRLLTCFQKGSRGRKAGRIAKTLALEEARHTRRGRGFFYERKVKVKRIRTIVDGKKRILYCIFAVR